MGEFTLEQRAFLDHPAGTSARLIAGPGAGKSYTCVAYMESHADGPFLTRIRMLTFTRAAAAEFADTMAQQGVGEGALPPSTIHGFALGVLRRSKFTGIPQPVRIASSWEEAVLIRPQISRLLRTQGHAEATPGTIEKLQREMAAGFDSMDPTRTTIAKMRPALRNAYLGLWQQHRNRLGYVLLAELPYRAGLAIEDLGLPDLNLDLLLVDEYQDLNRADIQLIRLVADAGLPVVAIGDEDQSIYGWRHAAPLGIRDFRRDFNIAPEHDYRLTVSRRCGTEILRAAQTLIEQSPGRPKQKAMTALDPAKAGEIAYIRFAGMAQEADGIAKIVAARIAAGVPTRKIAILCRTRVDQWVAALKPAFDKRDISIASSEWVDLALANRALIRLRALAQLSLDAEDSLSWMTLIELEPMLGKSTLDNLYNVIRADEVFAVAVRRVANAGTALGPAALAKLRTLVERTTQELDGFKLDEDGTVDDWGQWLTERATEALSEDALRLLALVGSKIKETSLEGFLAQLEPAGGDFALSEQDAVRFMTIGSSKGLTFDTAIVLGVEDGNIPAPRNDIDEERRLLYVGMTRATDLCVLTYCTTRTGTLARSGRENLGKRVRSTLTEGVIAPVSAATWIRTKGWE